MAPSIANFKIQKPPLTLQKQLFWETGSIPILRIDPGVEKYLENTGIFEQRFNEQLLCRIPPGGCL